MVILNGVSPELVTVWRNWKLGHPARVEMSVYPVNEPGISQFWPIIRNIKTKWIAFPSDDDVLSDAIFEEWISFENQFGNFGAIATPLQLIDFDGSGLGILRKSDFLPTVSPVLSFAKSLSECPFLWPGLIFNVQQLPKLIPNSRYVTDWWLGLYMMLTSSVTVVNLPFVQYRIHNGQESAISSLSRKNLEALIHIGQLIKSDIFATWIKERSEAEVIELLHSINKFPPIYGDTKCGSELVSIITSTISSLRGEKAIILLALQVNAFVHDVLVDNSQLKFLGNAPEISKNEGFELNFCVELDNRICSKVEFIRSQTPSYDLGEHPIVRIGCLHSLNKHLNVKIDCANLAEPDQTISLLLLKSTEYLQSIDAFRSEVSLFEYYLVKKLRLIKARVPRFVFKLLYHRVRNR